MDLVGGTDLRFSSSQPDTCLRGCVSCGVPVYSPVFAGTHGAYPWRDGQAELTWMAVIRPKTATHPGTNRARRSATALIETDAFLSSVSYLG